MFGRLDHVMCNSVRLVIDFLEEVTVDEPEKELSAPTVIYQKVDCPEPCAPREGRASSLLLPTLLSFIEHKNLISSFIIT